MNKFVFPLLASTALAAVPLLTMAGTASAQTAPEPFNWTGFYVGLLGGYGWSDSNFDFSSDAVLFGFSDLDLNADGVLGGVQLGYDKQLGNFVIGIVGDVTFGDFGSSESFAFGPGDEDDFGASIDMNWMATLRGKAGVAAGDFMFFGTAGLALADFDAKTRIQFFGDPGFGDSESGTELGYVLGIGTSAKLTPNLVAELTYLFADFGSFSLNDEDDFGSGDIDFSIQQIRFGFVFTF